MKELLSQRLIEQLSLQFQEASTPYDVLHRGPADITSHISSPLTDHIKSVWGIWTS